MDKNDIGFVLSGGGYRGVAHAGAIKAFEEFGIVATCISGTSAGALAGALYAADYTPEDILEVFREVKIFALNRYAKKNPDTVDTNTFKEFLLNYFPENSFASLNKKLFITTTDLLNGRVKIFHSGDLIEAILASASFPGIFSPVAIRQVLYADGGILDNFPVDPLKYCQRIYGIYVNPIGRIDASELKHSKDIVRRAFQLKMHMTSMAKFSRCDMVIYPQELNKFKLFDPNPVKELFDIGYQSTYAKLKSSYSELHYLEQ